VRNLKRTSELVQRPATGAVTHHRVSRQDLVIFHCHSLPDHNSFLATSVAHMALDAALRKASCAPIFEERSSGREDLLVMLRVNRQRTCKSAGESSSLEHGVGLSSHHRHGCFGVARRSIQLWAHTPLSRDGRGNAKEECVNQANGVW
jgi:hypothetical protein